MCEIRAEDGSEGTLKKIIVDSITLLNLTFPTFKNLVPKKLPYLSSQLSGARNNGGQEVRPNPQVQADCTPST